MKSTHTTCVIDIYQLTGKANTNKRNTKTKTPPKQQKHYTTKMQQTKKMHKQKTDGTNHSQRVVARLSPTNKSTHTQK